MDNRQEVINHLQIISTWTSFALKYDTIFLDRKHIESINRWVDDAVELLNKEAL